MTAHNGRLLPAMRGHKFTLIHFKISIIDYSVNVFFFINHLIYKKLKLMKNVHNFLHVFKLLMKKNKHSIYYLIG